MLKAFIGFILLAGPAQATLIGTGGYLTTPSLTYTEIRGSLTRNYTIDVLEPTILLIQPGLDQAVFPNTPIPLQPLFYVDAGAEVKLTRMGQSLLFFYAQADYYCVSRYCTDDYLKAFQAGRFESYEPGQYTLSYTIAYNNYSDDYLPATNSVSSFLFVKEGLISFDETPEPGTYLLLGSGLALFLYHRHRSCASNFSPPLR